MAISDTIFHDLDKQYTAISEKGEKAYLVLSSSGIPVFKSYWSSIFIFFARIFGSSFDLTKSVPVMRANASHLFKNLNFPSDQVQKGQLERIIKVLSATRSITSHARPNAANLQEEVNSTLTTAFERLAAFDQKSVVQIALENNSPEIALAFVHNGEALTNIPVPELRKLVPLCGERKEFELLLQLIKVDRSLLAEEYGISFPLHDIAGIAISAKDERGLGALIDSGWLPMLSTIDRMIENRMDDSLKRILSMPAAQSQNPGVKKICTYISAQENNKPLVQVLLEYGTPERAYRAICDDWLFFAVPRQLLEKIVPIAVEEQNPALILNLLALGVTVPKEGLEEGIGLTTLAHACFESYNEEALLALIKMGLDLSTQNRAGVPLLFSVVENGMFDAFAAMMDKGCSFNQRDKQGNTVLHHAFLQGSTVMCKELLKYCDPTLKNNDNLTPLRYFLQNQNLFNKKDFIKELFDDKFTLIDQDILGILENDRLSFVENRYLMGQSPDANFCTRKEFNDFCTELSKMYLPESVQRWKISAFRRDEFHYTMGVEVCQIESVPEDVEISDIKTLYNALNLQNKDKPGYLDPGRFFGDGNNYSLSEVGDYLDEFIHNIAQRVDRTGTPKGGSQALKIFYDRIQANIKHTVKALQEKNDPRLTLSVLKEYVASSKKCGGRYFSVALEQYLRICRGINPTPATQIYRAIAEFRDICLHNAVSVYKGNSDNVHAHNQVLKRIGRKYGIPGFEVGELFDEVYGNDVNVQAIKDQFLNLYTPEQIVFDWFFPMIKSDGEIREFYIDWHKENIPDSFDKEFFDKIKKELLTANKEEKISILEKYDIFYDSPEVQDDTELDESIDKAVKAERTQRYLEKVLYTNNELSSSAVVDCLERMGVIASLFE